MSREFLMHHVICKVLLLQFTTYFPHHTLHAKYDVRLRLWVAKVVSFACNNTIARFIEPFCYAEVFQQHLCCSTYVAHDRPRRQFVWVLIAKCGNLVAVTMWQKKWRNVDQVSSHWLPWFGGGLAVRSALSQRVCLVQYLGDRLFVAAWT